MADQTALAVKNEPIALTGQEPVDFKIQEALIVQGDLARLTPEQRVRYCINLCVKLGLNYLTRPFDYITLNNKLTLYARKDATDQLRKIHRINLSKPTRELDKDLGVVIVTVEAELPDGRKDASTGVCGVTVSVPDKNEAGEKVWVRKMLQGDELANAIMKAETKAKRRATLSICGLGFLDETEVETIPKAQVTQIGPINPSQVEIIKALIAKTGASLEKHLERFEVNTIEGLNSRQAEDLVTFLEAAQEGL